MRKRVLITGGAKGLGKAIVEEFAKNNFDIIFTYKTSEKDSLALKDHIESKYGVIVNAFRVNLEKDAEIDELISKIDYLNVLINNAAYNCDCDVLEKTSTEFEKILRVNLVAPFVISKGLFEVLKNSFGSIINIASTNGIDTMYKESLDYDASKAGLINLTQNLAEAFGPSVRVNSIAPGWISTENTLDMDPKFKKREEEKTILNRFASSEEIAKVVYFLASSDASYMTGSIVRVDGGVRRG